MGFNEKLRRSITVFVVLFLTNCVIFSCFFTKEEKLEFEITVRYKSQKITLTNGLVKTLNNSSSDNLYNVTTRGERQSTSGDCRLREVKLSPFQLPVTGLLSFPGSGNTWTRHLIQQMTGLATSSMYCDELLQSHGFPFEFHDDKQKTIVVKSHDPGHLPYFEKIILIIRNPFDAFLSYANLASVGHTGHAPLHTLKEVAAEKLEESLQNYAGTVRATTERFLSPVYILQYEKLKTDLANELINLAKFLDVDVNKTSIDCTLKLREGNFHRSKHKMDRLQLLRKVYSKDDLERIEQAARYTQQILKDAYGIDIDVGGDFEKILLCNDNSLPS